MSTQPNIPLLRKAVEWAEAEAAKPDVECRWDQAGFVTTPEERAMTVAAERLRYGWPVGRWNEYVAARNALADQLEAECGTCYCIAGYAAQLSDRPLRSPYGDLAEIGRQELGLDEWQAALLFGASNTIEMVREIAEDIAGERL